MNIYKDNTTVRIECIQECPDWLNWQLSNAPQTLKSLGKDIGCLESYSEMFNIWMRIGLDYTHVLTPDCTIFLRHTGVSGLDEADLLRRFLSPSHVQHLRYNLPTKCAAVREGYKKLKTSNVIIIPDTSDSEVGIVEPHATTEQRLKEEPEDVSSPLLLTPRCSSLTPLAFSVSDSLLSPMPTQEQFQAGS